MISTVTFVIDHGDTTDPFHQFIEEAERQGYEIPDCDVVEYDVEVDILPMFTLIAVTTAEDILEQLEPNPWRE